ncbi:MAG: dTDP-4-dehydrorhamnose reductase [Parachlamydiaceae bacterium]
MKKILITGKHGQIGHELLQALAPLGIVCALDRQQLDLTHPDHIRRVIREIQPDVIVNAAAYTLVDKAETDEKTALAINATAVGVLAEEAKKIHALLVHYSTDYVFDGTKTSPYCEEDVTNPINTYGKSKLEGEKAILTIGCPHLILRTSWVYGMHGNNFLLTMLRLGKERAELKIVDDQIGAPTWSRLIAEKTADLLSLYLDKKMNDDLSGIYNLTSAGHTSWLGFSQAIFGLHQQADPTFKAPQLTGIPSIEYPTPAKRPKFSVLSTNKIHNTFSINMPDWKESLKCCLYSVGFI